MGRGSSGKVLLVVDKVTSKRFAMKSIPSRYQRHDHIRNEFLQTRFTPCNNIVPSYELYFFMNTYYIIEELMKCNLQQFLDQNKILPEMVIAYILKEILLGLNYIHTNNCIHRDIKTDNVFIDESGNIKIGDFGEAVELTAETSHRTTIIGSPYWMSPEVCQGIPYNSLSDIWSLGIVLYELTNGKPPFDELQRAEIPQAIMFGNPPDIGSKWSEKLKGISQQCLQKIPICRSSAHQLLLNSYFKKDRSKAKEYIVKNLSRII